MAKTAFNTLRAAATAGAAAVVTALTGCAGLNGSVNTGGVYVDSSRADVRLPGGSRVSADPKRGLCPRLRLGPVNLGGCMGGGAAAPAGAAGAPASTVIIPTTSGTPAP